MLLLGLETEESRRRAWAVLAWGAEGYWGLSPLPEAARGERGKPYFPGEPGRHFNLSHSGRFVLCAMAEGPVGVDIQVLRPAWRDSLIQRSCTPEERAWLRSRGDRGEDFAALWACKESVGKQSGRGLPYPPSRLAVPLPPPGEGFCPGRCYAWNGLFLRVYPGAGWQAAVCALEPPPEKIIWLREGPEGAILPPAGAG